MSKSSGAHRADRDGFTEQALAWFALGEQLAAQPDGPYVVYEDESSGPDRWLRPNYVTLGSVLLALVVAIWLAM